MTTKLLQTTHTMPTPGVAGWHEESRRLQALAVRRQFERAGGRVISERRVRNIAFDKRGEKTTFTFVVEWSA